jgi:uncharacterized repeat protein (TIGR01451 family)
VSAAGSGLIASKTADAATAMAATQDGYTVTFHNTNTAAATLTSISDALPSGFAYVAGSTTGDVTAAPTIVANQLTWAGPFTVPAAGDLAFHFNVTVSTSPGHYTNSVTGASAVAVTPANNTAPIDVPTVVPVPALPLKGIPIALALVTIAGIGVSFRRRRTARAK